MTAATIDRTVVPVERLTSRGQMFRCEPYRAVLTVATCLSRRGSTYTGGRMKGHTPAQHTAFPECARCELGARVAALVPDAVPKATVCSVEGCGVAVPDAGRRKPLCAAHR